MIKALCKNCHQWTNRVGLETDRCEHCNELLDEHRISYRKVKHKIKEKSESESLLIVREEDSEKTRKIKRFLVYARVIFFILLFLVSAIIFLSHG